MLRQPTDVSLMTRRHPRRRMSHTTDVLPRTHPVAWPHRTEGSPLMALKTTLEIERVVVGAPHHDNSGLRARLSGQEVEPRSIVAELRAAMQELESGEKVVDVRENKRWR